MRCQLLWPQAIVIGLIVPAFLWFYVGIERRRRAAERQHPALYADASRASGRDRLQRHLPAALFVVSLTVLSIATTRPAATLTPFGARKTIVLVVDVSASMRAADVAPNRLVAAKTYAKQLVAEHADTTRFGLISFAGTAIAEADPGTGREELMTAIERLESRPGTAIGSGIEQALKMLFPDLAPETFRQEPALLGDAEVSHPASHAPGSNASMAVILMSDGQSMGGPTEAAVTRIAAELGVRIHAIGIGTVEGAVIRAEGRSMRVQLDETPLEAVAAATAGEYQRARPRMNWQRLMDALQPDPPTSDAYEELTAFFAAVAALSATGGALVSLFRTQRAL